MKRTLSLVLSLVVAFSIITGMDVSVFATSETTEAEIIDIDIYKAQCLAGIAEDTHSDAVERCNALFNRYINEEVFSPTKTFLEKCYNDKALMDDYNEWMAYSTAGSPSSSLDFVMKKEDYYESLIIAMYSEALTKDSDWEKFINNKIVNDTTGLIDELCNVLNLSQASQLDEVLDLSNPATFEYVTETVEKYYPIGTAGKVVGVVGTVLDYAKNITDVCQRISAYNSMVELDISAKLWLNQMYSSCDENTNPSLKTALLDLKSASTGFAEAALVDIKEASFSIANWGMKTVINYGVAQLASLNPITAAVVVGLQAGKAMCNLFFATDDECEQMFLMECIYDVQDLARVVSNDCKNVFINNQTRDNALSFAFAVDCYFESIINIDINCMIDFLDTLYNGGIFKGAITWMYGATDDFQEMVNTLNSFRDVRQNNYNLLLQYYKVALGVNYPDTYKYYFVEDKTIPISDISFMTSRILPLGYPVGYANIIVGDFANIDVQYVPSDTTQKAYAVTSDNPEVVEIKDNIMTAVSVGTANVTVTSVENPAVSYTAEIKVGEKLENAEAEELTNRFEYTVSNNEATITGLVDGYKPKKLTIPSKINGYSVICIGDRAFDSCTSLASITVPNGVTSIGEKAFEYCRNLTSITIPDSVISIDENAFLRCDNLNSVYISDIAVWCSIDFYKNTSNPLYSGAYLYLNGDMVTDLIIPVNVTSISDGAFHSCASLTKVTIPDSVTSIGEYAFYDCESLAAVTIGDNVTSIGYSAFSSCNRLTSITIPDNVTSIGNSAFSGCTRLTSITIPDSVTSMGERAFYDCESLAAVTIGDSVTSIDYLTFAHCDSLASVTFGNSVKEIDAEAFYNCRSLTSIMLPDSVTSIGRNAFDNTAYYNDYSNWKNNVLYIDNHLIDAKQSIKGAYTIREGTKTILPYAFSACRSLTSITIPDSVTSIGWGAFDSCDSLTSVYITDIAAWCVISFADNSANPLYYGDDLYLNGNLVTDLVIPDGIETIKNYAFYSCASLTSVTIGDSVTSIGGSAFNGCGNLTSVTIPDSVTSIGSDAFDYTAYYHDNNNWENDVLYIGNHLIDVKSIKGAYIIKEGTKTISTSAFYKRSGLTSITIPDSVTSIGNSAFSGCTGLTSITIPDSVTSMGERAFYDCESLAAVTIGDSVTSIDYLTFAHCDNLASVTIGDGVTSIGEDAFDDCKNLKMIIIPDGVTSIGASAFSGCTSLTSVTISDSVTSIYDYAFHGCTSLTAVTIGNSITRIGRSVFKNCNNIEYVFYNGSLSDWENILIDRGNISLRHIPIHYNATDHSCGEWIVTSEPTCTQTGTKHKECNVCKATIESEKIPATGHIPIADVAVTPTCTETGLTEGSHCSVCDAVIKEQTVMPAKGHTEVKVEAVEPTCTTAGKTEGSHCSVCNTVIKAQKTVAKKGHTASKWIVSKKATVNAAGSKYQKCTVCGVKLKTAVIPQLKCAAPKLKSVENVATGIKFTWNKVTGADNYEIYRKTGNGAWKKLATVKGTVTTYTDKTAKSGTTYKYTVKAKNEAGLSGYNTTGLTIKCLADPVLKAPTSTKSGITLKWNKVTGAQGYVVYRKAGNGKLVKLATVKGVSKISYTDKSAKKGTKYTYQIKAYSGKTYSAYSNAKTIKDKY